MPLSTLNLSKPHTQLQTISEDNITVPSSIPHGSAMAKFDPRHSEDKQNDIDWSLQQLAVLKDIFPQTGIIETHLFLFSRLTCSSSKPCHFNEARAYTCILNK